MVVAVGDAMTSGVPVPTAVPPQLTVYHFSDVPEPPAAERLILPASSVQKLLRSTDADVGAVGVAQTTMALVSVKTLLDEPEQLELENAVNEML